MLKVFSCLRNLKSWMLELDRNEFQYKVLMSFQLLLFTEEVEDIVGLFHPTLIFRDKSNFRLPISFMWLLGGLWVWETWLVIILLLPTILRKEINSGSTYHQTQEEVSLFALPPRKQFGNFLPYFNLEDITQTRALGLIKIS